MGYGITSIILTPVAVGISIQVFILLDRKPNYEHCLLLMCCVLVNAYFTTSKLKYE